MSGQPQPALWVDVDDLLDYLVHHSRPSGIQRVSFEISRALHHLDGGAGRVRFVRRDGGPRDIVTVAWNHLDAEYDLVANPKNVATPRRAISAAPPPAAAALPADAGRQQILMAAVAAEAQALRALARLPVLIGTRAAVAMRRRRAERKEPLELLPGVPLRDAAVPGDKLVVLGSPWHRRDYAQTVRWVRDELRMHFALLIHDIIPVRRPEWCDPTVVSAFVHWHTSVLSIADQVFTNSQATANDVVAWARERGVTLLNPVQPVPIGTGFGDGLDTPHPDPHTVSHLPAPGSYALFVSTLEARKNHMLLFRVWRRLLDELPRDQVPMLVFAGRVGWLVADLMQQLENANWLDGKIRLVRDPSDDELTALYRGCRFTLFPSLFEGWGLPVTESLALGRPCIASNRASLPEAGGDLARYFDPENLDDAYCTVRAVIDDPAGLDAWRERVARDFRRVSWERGAEVIRGTLDALDAA